MRFVGFDVAMRHLYEVWWVVGVGTGVALYIYIPGVFWRLPGLLLRPDGMTGVLALTCLAELKI